MAHYPTEEEMLAEWKAQPLIARAFMLVVFTIMALYMWATGKRE